MSEPEKRTAAATETLMKRTDGKYAARLRARGWLVVPPELVDSLPADVVGQVRAAMFEASLS